MVRGSERKLMVRVCCLVICFFDMNVRIMRIGGHTFIFSPKAEPETDTLWSRE